MTNLIKFQSLKFSDVQARAAAASYYSCLCRSRVDDDTIPCLGDTPVMTTYVIVTLKRWLQRTLLALLRISIPALTFPLPFIS